jgi:hypothetical protein
MAILEAMRRQRELRRAAATRPSEAAPRPAEAVPSPRRPAAARHLRSVPPGSLAASVMAAGLEDVALGLERLPRRRARRRLSRLVVLAALGSSLAAGAIWLQGRPPAAERAAPPAAAPPATFPDVESRRAAAAPAPAAEELPGPGGLAVSTRPVEPNYTVVQGETLERIAQRFGTTVDALVGMNNLRDRNSLRVGQPLIIP